MKKIKSKDAVAEILGSVLLLSIAVSVFSVVYLDVLSDDGPSPETYVTLVGKLETKDDMINTVAFENRRGQILGPDTEIILTIGGDYGDRKSITINELNSYYSFLGDGWNIGEKIYPLLIFPEEFNDLTGIKVDANIIDKKSNSLVFWGRLQEGYEVPPGGRGGIWHFNEPSWEGNPLEVIDSSGNENHGTAYGDANTVDYNVSGLTYRSGHFDYLDGNDFVKVSDAWSLDITNQITMEAWIKPYNYYGTGTSALRDKFGYTPYIIHGPNNIFIVVSEDQQQEGRIQTVNITLHNPLNEDSIIESEKFGDAQTPRDFRPVISHISGDVYVVAYNNWKNGWGNHQRVYLQRFEINSTGGIDFIGNEIFDDNNSRIGQPNRPSITKVYDSESYSIFAIAYSIKIDNSRPAVGLIRTVKISSDGTWDYTGEWAEFDAGEGYDPSIFHVVDDVFAVVYRNSLNNGCIKKFIIDSNGFIADTGEVAEIDTVVKDPSIINIDGNIFAVIYRGTSNNGFIRVFRIPKDGGIDFIGASINIGVASCFNPYIICLSEQNYVITYSTDEYPGNVKGEYVGLEISNTGSIIDIQPPKIFEDGKGYTSTAVRISDRIFAVVYEVKGHEGDLKLILQEYASDLYSKGIYKLESYGIYANSTDVFVNINTKTIGAPIVADSWNHVALTYDKDATTDQMKLYVNGGSPKNTRILTEPIKITKNDLIFGDLIYGLIDEIAIFDRALTYKEVQNHFNNPGVFENVS